MDSMVERVARAICRHEGDEEDWPCWFGEARAAIEAMRSAPEHLAADLRLDGQHIASYHDIIDAALNEQVAG